jgi:hypothetical protein
VVFYGAPLSSTNKTDYHDITEIFLKVALNTINQPIILKENIKYKKDNIAVFTTSQHDSHYDLFIIVFVLTFQPDA